jgi:hypothetical protein
MACGAAGRNNTTSGMSEQAQEMLQRAADRAVQAGRGEVDTEYLLYELPNNDVVQAILIRSSATRSQRDLHV